MMLKDSIITVEKLGRAEPGDQVALERAFGAEHAAQPGKAVARIAGWRDRVPVAGIGAVAGDGGAAAKAVGIEIDGDDNARAERARRRDRHRIDQRPVDQPALADMDRRKYSRQRIRGAQRQRQRAARQPDFVAGADFGRDRGKTHRQVLDQCRADGFMQLARQPPAADEAGAAEAHVEIADDAPHGQRARPGLQRLELVGDVTAADQSAHRRADHDVGSDTLARSAPAGRRYGQSRAPRRCRERGRSTAVRAAGRPARGEVDRRHFILGLCTPE